MTTRFDPAAAFEASLDFERHTLALFRLQAEANPVYKKFLALSGIRPGAVDAVERIPFLPINVFRTQHVETFLAEKPGGPEAVFASSGTTEMARSRHHVADTALYRRSLLAGFRHFYGDPASYPILACVPPAGDAGDSSLRFMLDTLMAAAPHPESGYYFQRDQALLETLASLARRQSPFILLGVTWALMDFAAYVGRTGHRGLLAAAQGIVMETGGMKGRRRELVRDEVHRVLRDAFGVAAVHSEYGMTELLSQAYSKGHGRFACPPWMRVWLRDVNDPAAWMTAGRTGAIHVIDLANARSCAFIATQDLGKRYDDGTFEVLGRFDDSDLRGCNLLVT